MEGQKNKPRVCVFTALDPSPLKTPTSTSCRKIRNTGLFFKGIVVLATSRQEVMLIRG
jgi:hypothetical protein